MKNDYEGNLEYTEEVEITKPKSSAKKSKTKRKLKLYKTLSVIFAILFLISAGSGLFFAIAKMSEEGNLKEELDALRDELKELSAENTKLNAELQQLSAQNADIQSKYDNLNISTADFQATITELQNQLTALHTENDAALADLQSKYDSVSSQLSSAKSSNDSLTSKNKSLTSQVSTLNNQISALKKENEVLRETINEISGGTVNIPETEIPEEEPETEQQTSNESAQTQKIAYLTIDDGCSKYTDTILDILAEYGVKATFFPNWKSGYNAQYKRIVDEGHLLANHTYSHDYDDVYTTLDGFISEVQRLNDKLTEITGYTPTIFRFPGGSGNTVHRSRNPEIMQLAIQALYDMGMQYYDWNVNSGDADKSSGASKDEIVSNVLSRSTMDKAIILIHDTNTKGTTVAALPEIIEGLIAKGYTFSVLSDGAAPVIQQVKKQ